MIDRFRSIRSDLLKTTCIASTLIALMACTGRAQVPAFPGAEGFGKYTLGGRAVQTVGGAFGAKPAVLIDTGFEPGQTIPELSHHRVVTGGAHTGEASVEGEVTETNQAAFLRLPFDVADGNRLVLSFWVQSDRRCRCAVWARIGENKRKLLNAVDRVPREWTKVTAAYKVPAGTKGVIEIVTPSSHGGSSPGSTTASKP